VTNATASLILAMTVNVPVTVNALVARLRVGADPRVDAQPNAPAT